MKTHSSYHNHTTDGFKLAFFLIVVGALLLAIKIGLFPSEYSAIIISWQMALILIGLYKFFRGKFLPSAILFSIGAFLKEQTMKYFQLHMSPHQFVRIHRSYIVNIHAISSVQLYEKQNYMVGLKSGLQLKASIAGYKRLKECLHV